MSSLEEFLPRWSERIGVCRTLRRKNRRGGDTQTDMSPRSGRVAFVLSGGASLGAVQVGMLQALYERDITPQLVVGTSAGAINGAFIASRPQTVETASELPVSGAQCGAGRSFR